MSDVLMPAELTAENGAKKAMVGEFYEELSEECHECGDSDYEADPEYFCDVCGGEREHIVRVGVSWMTIKAIYKKAVETVGKDASHINDMHAALVLCRDVMNELGCLSHEASSEQITSWIDARSAIEAALKQVEG